MKSCTCRVIFALTGLTLLGLAGPVTAQQPPQNFVPFKVTFESGGPFFVIPGNPPTLSLQTTAPGEAAPLGKFTFVSQTLTYPGVDGIPLFSTAVGAFTGVNGDALFFQSVAIRRPPVAGKPNLLPFDGAAVVTGGAGRFAGASGSGTFHGELSVQTGKGVTTIDALISPPKP